MENSMISHVNKNVRANNKRVQWLDIAKGIAIIAVVMGHVVASYHNSGVLLNATGFNFVYSFIGSFQMPFFFAISGYLFHMSDKPNVSIYDKIWRKVISYGIPYLIFSIGYWILKAFTSDYVNTKLNILDLVLIPLYPISFMWFIYALMIISIVFTLLNYLHTNKKIILGIGSIIVLIMPYINQLEVLNGIHFTDLILCDVLKWFLYFCLGAYAGDLFIKYLEKIRRNNTLLILNGITVVAIASICFFAEIKFSIIIIIQAILCISFFLQLSYRLGNNKPLEYIGRNSFPIYLMHGVILAVTRIGMNKLGIKVENGWVQLITCTITGTMIPLILYTIFQKIWIIDFCFYPNRYIKSRHLIR